MCQPTQVGACIPCQYNEGGQPFYFQINKSPYWDGYEAYSYRDSICSDKFTYANLVSDQCSTENAWENCIFFSQVESATFLSLTLTSTEAVVVSFVGDESVYAQISSNKVSAQGEKLGVQVHSDGKDFFVERRVSLTQYSSNLGVFTLGETYTRTPFTFTVSLTEIDFPLPPVHSDVTTITFSPFFSVQVTDDNTYPTIHEYNSEIEVLVDGTNNLEGLVLTNPFYSLQNMTLFPPFEQNNNHGQLVFQLEASSSPFLTVECYHDSTLGNAGYKYNKYDCELGSFFASLSFSLEVGEKKIRQPDEMSFSLF